MENNELKLITKIARLYYLNDLNQQAIAEKLNISRTKVSRYLTKAKKNKIIEIKISSPFERFEEFSYQIEKKYNVKECIIVSSSTSQDEIYKNLASALNELLCRILKEGNYIGVGWGMTLKSVVKLIEPSTRIYINVIPLVGGLGKIGIEVHTNLVASLLAEKFGGISYSIHSPAVLDSQFAKQILEKDSSIKEVLDMMDKVSVALLGMSDIGPDSTMVKTGNFTFHDFEYLASLGVVGDVNLIFIDRYGKEVKNKLDDRILKAPLIKIQKIKNVIGIAFGKKKVDVIRAALTGKIINILITDEETAINLLP